ncbi:MAG: HD domain-containing protein [Psychrilyobacter sp.]|nr:HD domain-containing protein [Psychrilyobacter sp.]
MINRVISIYDYIFRKPKVEEVERLKSILTPKEYEIFINMDDYDQIHSLKVYKLMKKDHVLKDKKLYLKLALLHDCGKGSANLYRRIATYIKKDPILGIHPILGYEKLKKLDLDLAKLVSQHHSKDQEENMVRFQILDDRS